MVFDAVVAAPFPEGISANVVLRDRLRGFYDGDFERTFKALHWRVAPGEDDAGLGLVVAGESAAVLRARRAQRFVCLGSLRRAAHALDEDAAKIVGGAVAQKLRQLNPAAGSEVQYDDGTTLIRAQLTGAAPEMCQACVAPTFTVAQCQHKARRLDLGSAVEPQGRPNAAIQAWFYKDDETAAAAARWCSRVAAAKVPEAIRPAFRRAAAWASPNPMARHGPWALAIRPRGLWRRSCSTASRARRRGRCCPTSSACA